MPTRLKNRARKMICLMLWLMGHSEIVRHISTLLAERAQPALEIVAAYVARVVRQPILWEAPIDRIVREPVRRLIESGDGVRRQRQHRCAEARVRIAVARPTVAL